MRYFLTGVGGAAVTLALLCAGVSVAFQGSFGASGGLGRAVADTLYCQLTGCTMTGTLTSSDLDVQGDITNEGTSSSCGNGDPCFQEGLDIFGGSGGATAGTQISNNGAIQNTSGANGGRVLLQDNLRIAGTGSIDELGSGHPTIDDSEGLELGAGPLSYGSDADTIADSGDGNPATSTLTPTSSHVQITCNDSDGCDITMGEAGDIRNGMPLVIVNVSANVVNFSDTSGVSELSGAIALGQYDSLTLVYASDRWIAGSTSNN